MRSGHAQSDIKRRQTYNVRFSDPSLVVSIVFDMTLRQSSVASLTVIVSL